ncbi:maleylpyruvate isomerase family mycothiol-dependent enzyme [Streptomyces oryzae]|uniref:Maleylpyruvate isomerase family mycothiol-dependent enzyme n=1 Tax=Streptomyces oryzae TaxID=1434886 RepID=A0ABS3XAA8_9ACTN|nr:maleylpyruvate isomerase family mycothiol-dependent enzyme [Streptomyces oryzae]MBO8192318.1 maleylpyruvate isomerase family mycothiol-dependent enzyme [Streptomyces oryzae]
MEISEFIDNLHREGTLFADAVEQADPAGPVPSCPDWSVRDLATHLGTVHRWAAGFIREARTEPVRPPEPPKLSELPDKELAPWLREGHGLLVEALKSAPDDLSCWTFIPAHSPLGFWSRRQAHETAVHRVDAELALGAPLSPTAAAFAADGVDELLCSFYPRGGTPEGFAADPRTVYVRATDVPGAAWTAFLGDPARAERVTEPPAAPDCTYEGTAGDLYLALWNRLPLSDLSLSGDVSVAHRWRELFQP